MGMSGHIAADLEQLSRGDANYMIHFVDSKVDILLKFPGQKFSPEQFFRSGFYYHSDY